MIALRVNHHTIETRWQRGCNDTATGSLKGLRSSTGTSNFPGQTCCLAGVCAAIPVQSIASWFFTVATWKTESLELNFVCLRFNLFWYGVWKGGTQYCLFYHQMSPNCSSSIYISYILIWHMRSEHLRNHGLQWGFPTTAGQTGHHQRTLPVFPRQLALCVPFSQSCMSQCMVFVRMTIACIYTYILVVRIVTYTCVVPSQKAEEKPTIWIPIRSICWGIMRVLMSCQGNKLSKGKWSKSFVHRDVQSWPNLKFTVLHFFKVSFYGPDIASVLDSAIGGPPKNFKSLT